MWIIKSIFESDYGCEERMPGEPVTVEVCLEADDGRVCRFEVADEWLRLQELDEGDEWPEELTSEENEIQAIKMNEWYSNYLNALEEMN